jgi:hypothetical protein
VALAGQLFAPHYARPVIRRSRAKTPAFAGPSETYPELFQLTAGEEFAVLDVTGNWAWGYRRSDHLVGYIPESALE